jgi:hypothetical protein
MMLMSRFCKFQKQNRESCLLAGRYHMQGALGQAGRVQINFIDGRIQVYKWLKF